ncbi:MAG: T9SS type A sorting domain-containing protein [Desulfobulbaceae bacterium]|nr:T9SS type A sorting domain-containing protein [Desulfobulbaceae bacterium]
MSLTIVMFMLLVTDNMIVSQELEGKKDPVLLADPQVLCCPSIEVNYTLDEDCCADIDIFNPLCDSARVEIQYFDPTSMSWVTKHVENPMTSYLNFKLCPEYYRTTMEFRVTFFNLKTNSTYCSTYWEEGTNVFTFEVNLEQCCSCPEEETNSWFTFTAQPDPECPDSCKVVLNLDIPDSVSCYKYYVYAIPQLNIWEETPRLIENELISQFTACLGPGESIYAMAALMIDPYDYTSANYCLLEAVAICDTTGLPVELPKLNPPCEVSCPDSLWTLQEPLFLPMTSCTDCLIKIHYVTRNNCNGKQELQILRMEKLGPCWGCSDEAIYEESLKFTIATNAMDFEPTEAPNCDTTWRIGMGSCWTSWDYYQLRRVRRWSNINPWGEWVIVTDTITVMEVCDSTACCFHEITVCRLLTGGIDISIDSTSTSFQTCALAVSRNLWDLPVFCLPVCHWLDDIGGFYGFIIGKRNIDNNELRYGAYEVNTVVNNGNLIIQINSDARKQAKIIIYDLLGNQIYAEEIHTHIGTTKNTIELTNFKTGFYVYAITIDDKLIKSDKFIYLK